RHRFELHRSLHGYPYVRCGHCVDSRVLPASARSREQQLRPQDRLRGSPEAAEAVDPGYCLNDASEGGDWCTRRWVEVAPGKTVTTVAHTNNSLLYYYAKLDDDASYTWSGYGEGWVAKLFSLSSGEACDEGDYQCVPFRVKDFPAAGCTSQWDISLNCLNYDGQSPDVAMAAAATVLFIRRRRVGGAGLPTIGPNNSAGGASKPFPTATAATISPSSSSAQGQSSELDSFVVHCPAQAAGRGAGVDSFVSMPAMGGLGSVPPQGYTLDSFVTQPSVAGLNSLPADTH
ncbi:hypothetical protein ABPG77_003700, partial [Micractinium sp. CCAP 211/92]